MHPLLKRFVIGAFHSLGLEVSRRRPQAPPAASILDPSAPPRHSLAGVLRHAQQAGLRPATVIDVGTAFGTFPLYETFPKARHLLVEPMSEWEENLKAICRQYKGEYVLAVAGDKPGRAFLNVYPYMLGSSVLDVGAEGVRREVPSVRLDDVCRQKGLRGPYVLKIDAEGAELQVLAGASQVLRDTELVILEVSLFEFFARCPVLAEIVAAMRQVGFVVYDVVDFHYRPLDGAVAKVDLAFAPGKGFLRRSNQWGQPTAAERERDAWVLEKFANRAA